MTQTEAERPPVIPLSTPALARAIMLLGSRAKGELTPKRRVELAELVGRYPSAAEAQLWKRYLKRGGFEPDQMA